MVACYLHQLFERSPMFYFIQDNFYSYHFSEKFRLILKAAYFQNGITPHKLSFSTKTAVLRELRLQEPGHLQKKKPIKNENEIETYGYQYVYIIPL